MKTQKFVVTLYLRDDEDPGAAENRHRLHHLIDVLLPTFDAFDYGVDRVIEVISEGDSEGDDFDTVTVALGEPLPCDSHDDEDEDDEDEPGWIDFDLQPPPVDFRLLANIISGPLAPLPADVVIPDDISGLLGND